MKIGVFDSGVGGLSVVKAIEIALPEAEVLYAEDKANIPYGNKSPQQLYGFVMPILYELVNSGCQVIVIACNTVTTTIIDKIRSDLSVPVIGMEPMVKPAAKITKSGVVAVCATPATLASERYNWLKSEYAKDVRVLEPDCSDWALMIENSSVDQNKIRERIKGVCEQGADVIVLGCTHYHWIEQEITDIAKAYHAEVLQPEQPVIEQLKRVIARLS